MSIKKVAIIGAGVAGICSAKTVKQAGLQPTVFDKAEHIGGVWSPAGLTWSNMHTNVGNHIVSLSDFPWPKGSLIFPSSSEVYQYLLDYCDKFNINDRFRLGSKVTSVKLLDDKRWQITYECNGQTAVEIFDYCIISNGFNSQPHIPEEYLNGSEAFRGEIMHSGDFKSKDDRLKGKKVIVIGASFSAVEIASDLVDHAASVTTLFKNKYLVFPKITREQTNNGKIKLSTIDTLIYSRSFRHALSVAREKDPFFLKRIYAGLSPVQTNKAQSDPELFVDLDEPTLYSVKFSYSEEFVSLVQNSKMNAKHGYIKGYRSDGIVTDDGTFIETDVIMFCTCYKMNLSFFDDKTLDILKYSERYVNDPIALYKNTWHPDLPNMGFAGMVQGLIFIIGELQAKWITKVFTNQLQLPSREIMLESVNSEAEKREKNIHVKFPYPFNFLCNMLSAEADLLDLDKERRENPELYEMLWNGPCLPQHFQLNEPDKRDAAIEQIKYVNSLLNREFGPEEAEVITVHNFV